MSLRKLALLCALAFSGGAGAAEVSEQQAAQLIDLLGLRQAIAIYAVDSVGAQPMFQKLASEKRACVAGLLEEILNTNTQVRLKTIFGNSAQAESWIAFSKTAAGQRYIQYVAANASAAFLGRPRPDRSGLLLGMTPDQAAQTLEFMASPAGMVFSAAPPLSPPEMTQAQQASLGDELFQRCALSDKDFS
ncbi:hypothetical protein [Xanthomonas sacchari]|uniref:hypothetical protein n=1 Tax=Xanthomonas sacchari TaxID=56458 RepID=UPI0022595149|nr:hypothetical protein [Xanthomonas sacchari]